MSINPSHTAHSSLTNSFPPFPPPNPYILHVGGPDQWHDVLLSIRWIESEVKPRDETATREVIALAMKDVLAHAAVHDQYIPLSYELRYEVKDVVLHRFDRTTYYTWDLWKIVLEGIEQFVKAYDGIYFLFKIFLGEKTVRQQLGTGALSGP